MKNLHENIIKISEKIQKEKNYDLIDNVEKKRKIYDFSTNKGQEESLNNFINQNVFYAQDATRKKHYKKLLKYIRVIDYVFNEAKFNLIKLSLEQLKNKFTLFYQNYINNENNNIPILKITLFTLSYEIKFIPEIVDLNDLIFDKFIQNNIYSVIYKKSFIDPQEFPQYMTVFEEVFDTTVDQNANLNLLIKEHPVIVGLLNDIKEQFNNCCNALVDYSNSLQPVLDNFHKFNKINFKELENSCTPQLINEYLVSFVEESKVVRSLKKIVNIGLFELDCEQLLEMVVDAPSTWLTKVRLLVPIVIEKKITSLIEILRNLSKNLSIKVNNI